MLDFNGLVVAIQVKSDDSAAAVLLVYRGRDINVAIVSYRQVTNGTEAFRHDARMEIRLSNQPIWLGAPRETSGQSKENNQTRFHRVNFREAGIAFDGTT